MTSSTPLADRIARRNGKPVSRPETPQQEAERVPAWIARKQAGLLPAKELVR